MTIWRTVTTIALAVFAALTLAACDKAAMVLNPPDLHVDRVYVKLNANPDAPSAMYFTVSGGGEETKLMDVIIETALRYQMHETVREGGMTEMREIDYVVIPAGEEVQFAPGGRHVMVWGIDQRVIDANRMPVIFVFQNGDRIEFDAEFIKPGENYVPEADDGKEATVEPADAS